MANEFKVKNGLKFPDNSVQTTAFTGGGAGTVTSVSGTGTVSGLSLSGTVTSSGNLTLSGTLAVTPSNFASQTANQILAAPNGAAGVPTFRALVAADIPTLNQNTTGSAGSVAWSGVTSKPTTLAGYGITDAASSTHTHSYLPLAGGTMTGAITFAGAQTWPTFNQNTTGSAGSVAWSGVTSKPTTLAGYGITDALPLAGGTLTGQLISTDTYDAATGGGNIYLNSSTGNRIDFNANGIAAPAFTTRSAGTKIVLYPSLGPAAADMAIGVESDSIWFSTYTTAAKFKWYAGTTLGLQLLNGVLSATTGFQINGAATSGQYLRGNGTNFVSSAIQAADIPTLNQNTTGSSGSCTGNAASASSVPWSGVTSKPTTLSGYGITDAQPLDADLTAFAAKTAPTGAVVGTTDSQTLTNKTLTGYTETVYSLSGTAIDPANGTIQYKTLSANTTFTESLADGQSVTLMLNPGTYTATWPTTTWIGSAASTAPTLVASVYNCITFFQIAGTFYGKYEGRV